MLEQAQRRFFQGFARVHGWLLLRTDGRPHRLGLHRYALVLETVGRRSGQRRAVPLLYLPDRGATGERYIVLASNYGQERPPAWWFNLQADADADVLLAGRRIAVRAHELDGDERAEVLVRAIAYNAQWKGYQDKVERRIPVVALVPR